MNNSQTVEALIRTLEEAIVDHRLLLRIAREEQEAIVAGDLPQVETATWRKEEVAGRLRALAPRQKTLMRQALDDDRSPPSVTRVIQSLPDSAARVALRRQRDELRLLIQSLDRTQRITSRLLLRALHFADSSVRLLKQVPDANPTYAPAGNLQEKPGERYLMDRRA